MSEQQHISVITGIFIINEKKEIWFGRMLKWNDKLAVVGGHVEYGETILDGALRELREETGIEAETLEYIGKCEIIEPDDYTKKKHFIGFNFFHHVTERPEFEYNDEFTEGIWLTREEALKRDDLNVLLRSSLESMEDSKPQIEHIDYQDKWMRAQADYQNLQREIATNRSQWAKMSEVQILEEFIPVYNNFKTAFAHQPEEGGNWTSWAQGIGFIQKQFADIFKAHQLIEVPTVGHLFDITRHEAVGEDESDEYEEGSIIKEIEAGYMMGDKVIRPAKVIVCKK